MKRTPYMRGKLRTPREHRIAVRLVQTMKQQRLPADKMRNG